MTLFGSLAFLSPWLLLGLLALPILWWLLRAVPPAPTLRRFPGVRILLGLDDPEKTPDKTPWWLLLLRLLAIAAAILAFARPVLNPDAGERGSGPLLVLMDGGWASAPDWKARLDWSDSLLTRASRDGRPVALVSIAQGWPQDGELTFSEAGSARERLALMLPQPWHPDRAGFAGWLAGQETGGFETVWVHDGLASGEALAEVLREAGPVTLVATGNSAMALRPARLEDGLLKVTALQAPGLVAPVSVRALGPDPSGIERVLGEVSAEFAEGEGTAELELDLPFELRNRITRLELVRGRNAGGVSLADDALRRRKVGLLAGGSDDEGQQLVQPLHFLRKALEPSAELVEASLDEILTTAPDMIVLADVGTLAPAEARDLLEWVEEGGLLLRFAGPRLAQSGAGQVEEDPLLPVRLRAGGRSVGGTMSWGAPKRLRPFPEDSPFFGLALPGDVDVSSQVMAQPDPDLPNRVMAALEDGTPLVTGRTEAAGRVVLFHVTANAEWSSLPISGLFVQMLDRLTLLSGQTTPDGQEIEGSDWRPERILDGFGRLAEPGPLPGVDGEALSGERDAQTPPGVYVSGERRVAVNLMDQEDEIVAMEPPTGVATQEMGLSRATDLQPVLLTLALILLAADVFATLILSGRLWRGATAAMLAVAAMVMSGPRAEAQDMPAEVYAANNTVLAFVQTGDARVDGVSEAGLRGLTEVLYARTAIEPEAPVAVDLETDSLAFYPFLYWAISERQQMPSDEAYAKLNTFLRSGGMILFDTREAHLGGGSLSTPNGQVMQRLAAKLDVPALEPVPEDHVLTRTFYLLQAFPGRWNTRHVWVEAAPDAQTIDGLPFRNLNDGVTPVVIGGNDWASAWAIDDNGQYMFPVGSGAGGQRQREFAFRFGVNLIMYVMTGNYKSDQVHVPALLERLGQ